MFLTLTVVGAVSALGSVFLFELIRAMGFRDRIALVAAALYAFGTPVFFYSTVFFQHIFTATFGIAGLYIAIKVSDDSPATVGLFIAGLVVGAGLLVEYPAIIVAAWIAVFLAFRVGKRQLVLYLLGVGVPALIVAAYQWAVFKSPFATSYDYLAFNERFHTTGFFGFTYPHLDRLISLLVSQDAGLFLYAPIALLCAAGIAVGIAGRTKNTPLAALCAGLLVSFLVFYSAYSVWNGGAEFGPRFLVPVLPFLAVGLAFVVDRLPGAVLALVAAISVLVNWAGAQFGFATSPVQHVLDVFSQGPTLPAFGAVLSHAVSNSSSLYLFVARYHAALTLTVTVVLLAAFVWTFRATLWPVERLEQPSRQTPNTEIP